MQRAWLVAVMLLAPLTTGCLGGVEPARIPKSTLDGKAWQKTSDSSEALAAGLGEKVTREYRPASNLGTTGVIVVSVNDVPLLDEKRFLPQAIEQVEAKRNIELTKSGSTSLSLLNLDGSVDADVYDFQKSGAQGKAVLFTPNCSAFVVVVGYGITDAGGFTSQTTYGQAKDVARAVAC